MRRVNRTRGRSSMGSPTIVLFYADWCGHCKNFKGAWGDFAKRTSVKTKTVNVDTVDEDQMIRLIGKRTTGGVPAVYRIYEGQNIAPREYTGDRSAESLLKFAGDV